MVFQAYKLDRRKTRLGGTGISINTAGFKFYLFLHFVEFKAHQYRERQGKWVSRYNMSYTNTQ